MRHSVMQLPRELLALAQLASLMNKLGARNRVEIAIWAHETKRIKA